MPVPSIWNGSANYLINDFYFQLGQLGVSDREIAPYQTDVLNSLTHAHSVDAAHGPMDLLRLGRLDYASLITSNYDFRKPRISLSCSVTSKGNLSAIWHPYLLTINFERVYADEWLTRSAGQAPFARPDNELLFVKSFSHLRKLDRTMRFAAVEIDVHLLTIALATWGDLKQLLKVYFDVQILREPVPVEGTRIDLGIPDTKEAWGRSEIAVGFREQDLIELERTRLSEYVSNFESHFDITPEKFWAFVHQFKRETGTVNSGKAARELKKLGHSLFTEARIDKALKELSAAHEARLWMPVSNVVRLNNQ